MAVTGQSSLNRRGLMLLYVSLTTTLIYFISSSFGYDDPYITYRYAQNILSGQGFVYNPGEHVLSTTTPLFTILLALGGSIWSDLPHLANLIGSFCLAVGAIFLWDLAQTWETPLVGWAALLLYPTFPLLYATLGSETPLYIALILGCFAAYARRRYNWVSVFAALAVLARPDGLLVPMVLGIHYLIIERRPIPWSAVILFAGLLLPWLIFSSWYFGSPVPATLATKQHQGSMAISQRFAEGILTTFKPYSQSWNYWVIAFYSLIGFIWACVRARRWLLFLSWGFVYCAAYILLGVSRYHWYYAPLVPLIVALAGLGVAGLISLLGRISDRLSGARVSLLLCLLLVIPLVPHQVQGAMGVVKQTARLEIYHAIGQWLDANLPPNTSVGALEVGIIGYYAHRPMVDFAGLIQPDIAGQLNQSTTYEDAALSSVAKFKPDYLVLQDGNFPRLDHEFVSQRCQPIAAFTGEQYRYPANLSVYRCR